MKVTKKFDVFEMKMVIDCKKKNPMDDASDGARRGTNRGHGPSELLKKNYTSMQILLVYIYIYDIV